MGTFAKDCLNIFSEKQPLFIITPAPHSPRRVRVVWETPCSPGHQEGGRWKTGDCWLGPRVVAHDHGGVEEPPSSLGMQDACTRRGTRVGLPAGTCRRAGFCSRILQIRMSRLCFPQQLSIHFSATSLSLAFPASKQKVRSGDAKVQLDKNEKKKKKSHHLSLCSS